MNIITICYTAVQTLCSPPCCWHVPPGRNSPAGCWCRRDDIYTSDTETRCWHRKCTWETERSNYRLRWLFDRISFTFCLHRWIISLSDPVLVFYIHHHHVQTQPNNMSARLSPSVLTEGVNRYVYSCHESFCSTQQRVDSGAPQCSPGSDQVSYSYCLSSAWLPVCVSQLRADWFLLKIFKNTSHIKTIV